MNPDRWRLVRTGPLPGAMNMALDEVLLNAVAAGRSRPILRLYRWRPAAVSLGYAQRGGQVVNLAACRRMGVEVVRRMTGGRAVLHDDEVTYSVMAELRGGVFSERVLDNYRIVSDILLQTLRSLGLAAAMADVGRKPAGDGASQSACFTAPSRHELLCHGCKIAGSAQKLRGAVFLLHGSIPVDLDPARLFRALDTSGRLSPDEGGRALMETIGWVNRWARPPVTVAELEARLIHFFSRGLGVEFEERSPSPEEWRASEHLVAARYGNRDWTLRGLVEAPAAE